MTSKLDFQSKAIPHQNIQNDIQSSSSFANQNLLIDSLSRKMQIPNAQGKCKVHDSDLENNVSL